MTGRGPCSAVPSSGRFFFVAFTRKPVVTRGLSPAQPVATAVSR
jgi:hypothetical protein